MEFFSGLKAVANVHPIFVHFPIAMLLASVGCYFAAKFVFKEELFIAFKWNLFLGSVLGVITVVTGFIAAATVPHNDEIHRAMMSHRNIMIPAISLSLFLAGYLFFKKSRSMVQENIYFMVGLIVMALLITIGADYGGKMVFKYGAGTELFSKLNPETHNSHESSAPAKKDDHDSHSH